jgi:hypothetical protein
MGYGNMRVKRNSQKVNTNNRNEVFFDGSSWSEII